MNDTKCACLNVSYRPIEHIDGSKEEQWMCLECKSLFIRKSNLVTKEEIDNLLID